MEIKNHIEANPKIMLGKPVIKGTRITVEIVLRKLSDGFSKNDILEMYPHIKTEDIQACIAYAAEVIESEKVIKAA